MAPFVVAVREVVVVPVPITFIVVPPRVVFIRREVAFRGGAAVLAVRAEGALAALARVVAEAVPSIRARVVALDGFGFFLRGIPMERLAVRAVRAVGAGW